MTKKELIGRLTAYEEISRTVKKNINIELKEIQRLIDEMKIGLR